MDPALHRSFGDLEETGDLDAGQVPGMAQRQDRPVTGVELIKGPVELTNRERLLEGAGGCRMLEIELGESVLPFRRSEGRPNDLSAKPGWKGIRIPEGIKAEPRGEQGLLDRIVSSFGRASDEPRCSKRRRQVRADELPECITIAGASGFDEGGEARPWAGRHRGHT
jgi:hypothetical protein